MNAQKVTDQQCRQIKQADVDAVMAVELRCYPFPWTAGIFRDCLYAGHECWIHVFPVGNHWQRLGKRLRPE